MIEGFESGAEDGYKRVPKFSLAALEAEYRLHRQLKREQHSRF